MADFRDRVVHHAVIDRLEPILDRRLIATSFACRRGKGNHAALRCARDLVRRHRYYLKLDVRKCFESLDHDVVLDTLGRIVKDRRVLRLLEVIVRATPAEGRTGVGLPIGNLTSQWLANLVLGRLDHFVKGPLRVPGYVRYMDDFVLFDGDKSALRGHYGEVAAFLGSTLRLELKARATRLAPVHEGLSFLGWRIYPGTIRLASANRRRAIRRVRHRHHEYATGRRSEESYAACVRSLVEHLRHGDTLSLRRSWFPSLDLEESGPARARHPPAEDGSRITTGTGHPPLATA